MADLGERVMRERRARGWSIRTAAVHGGISNTTWAAFEKGQPLGRAIQRAVSQAFGWPVGWPSTPAAVTQPDEDGSALQVLAEQVRLLGAEIATLRSELADAGLLPAHASPTPARSARSPKVSS